MPAVPKESALQSFRRRSQRILLSTRITVGGEGANQANFEEQTETVAVNAHGALILLDAPVKLGQNLHLRHEYTGQEAGTRVAHVGNKQTGKTQVGVEFITPSPDFWHVAFPPDDWSPRHPDARSIGIR